MLAIFRTNQQLASSLLIFYALLVRFWVLFSPVAVEPRNGGILADWMFSLVGGNAVISVALATLLLFLQAFMINNLVINHRLSNSVNLFPGLFYLLITSSLPIFLYLSPLHLANTFYILALMALLPTYKREENAGMIFNAGLCIGLGGLCYSSYLLFTVFGIVTLLVLRALSFREWLMVLSGVLIPYFFAWLFYFWYDRGFYFLEEMRSGFAWLGFPDFDGHWQTYLSIGLFSLLVLVALLSKARYVFKTQMQVQKKITVIYWAMLISAFTVLIQSNVGPEHLLILAVPLAVFISLNFSLLPRQTAEALHLIWLAMVSLVHYVYFISG